MLFPYITVIHYNLMNYAASKVWHGKCFDCERYSIQGATVINMRKRSHWFLSISALVVVIVGLTWGIPRLTRSKPLPVAHAGEPKAVQDPDPEPDPDPEQPETKIPVKVVHPIKGVLERLSTQPGSIQAYESVRLFAKVPGFLKWQNVVTEKGERPLDIGDKVKRGQRLAVVDVPELESQLKRAKAGIKLALSRVDQMKARATSAEASLKAAKAAVTKAEAMERSAAAWVRYRSLQYDRMQILFKSKSIEEKLVDEYKEHLEASIETELSAKETITASKANVDAGLAKIEEAKADVEAAKSEVEVAEAEYEKIHVQVSFATIYAPFDGVITQRRFVPGDYIRSGNEGGNEPLLTVDRTDLFRVVVQIPDRDVPFTDPGDAAFVQLDALPGEKLPAKVSRIASYEDPQTRLMKIELDLPNPTGKIRHGMYGQVTIVLDPEKELLSIPSSCIVGKVEDGKGIVYAVRDGHAQRLAVRLGTDNGLRVAILGGLTREDEVILHPGSTISDGVEVAPTPVD
jgi:HlyD family secretion protein